MLEKTFFRNLGNFETISPLRSKQAFRSAEQQRVAKKAALSGEKVVVDSTTQHNMLHLTHLVLRLVT